MGVLYLFSLVAYLDGMKVVASESPDASGTSMLCTRDRLRFGRGETKHIACKKNTSGRYVKISLPGKHKMLALCEVEVYAPMGNSFSEFSNSGS